MLTIHLKISVDVSDNESGIEKVLLGYMINRYPYEYDEGIYNEKTKKYEFDIVIEEGWSRTFALKEIIVIDKAGNELSYSNINYPRIQIIELNDKQDFGEIKKIHTSTNRAKVGDTVKYIIETDGKLENLYMEYKGGNKVYYVDSSRYNEEKGIYEITIGITNDMKGKAIIPANINGVLEEKLREVYNEKLIIKIEDDNGMIDTISPKLKSCNINNQPNEWHDYFNLSLDIDLGNDLFEECKAVIKYKSRRTGQVVTYTEAIKKEANIYKVNLWAYFLDINDKYDLLSISIQDKAGNRSIYTNKEMDFSNLTVTNGKYISDNKVDIELEAMSMEGKSIKGIIRKPNVNIKVYSRGENLGQIEEYMGVSDNEGEFSIDNNNYSFNIYNKYYFELNDSITGEYLGTKELTLITSSDVNGDGVIDILDIAYVASAHEDRKLYWRSYDINNDEIIDIYDIIRVAKSI